MAGHRRGPARAGDTQFVDLQRDATVADVLRATGAGLRSVEHVKRYTTIGTAHDQGKTSGVIATGIIADAAGRRQSPNWAPPPSARRTRRCRSPPSPAATAATCSTRSAVTAIHDWHVAHGAEFEDVGQWKRPWYYPRAGEDMDAAVRRECRAARTGVGMMDGSTLGKIDVQGADAGEFLDRLYTNMMSTLAVGFDPVRRDVRPRRHGHRRRHRDPRLAEDRYLVTTTTGNAARILDWMEEWLQTEWPELRVHCTSVTEQWADRRAGRPRAPARCSPRSPPTSTCPTRRSRS